MRATVLVLTVAVLPGVAQTVNMRPGKYETTAKIDLAGMKMEPQKQVECITADDLKDMSKALLDPEFTAGCKVTSSKVVGNKMTFDTDCQEDDLRMTGVTEMTFASESFSAIMTMKDNKGRVTKIETTAKRIGECAK